MRALGALILALGIGYFAYHAYFSQRSSAPGAPRQQIDVAGVEADLRTMAAAERQFLVAHGRYGSLEELAREQLLSGGTERRGYRFTADVNGSAGFTIVAEPMDSDRAGWPTLSIDQSMQISRQ